MLPDGKIDYNGFEVLWWGNLHTEPSSIWNETHKTIEDFRIESEAPLTPQDVNAIYHKVLETL